MNGPARGDVVTLIVPQHERVSARVLSAGLSWYQLQLLEQPRTPDPVLARSSLYLQFAGLDGIGRMLGTAVREDDHRLRFTARGGIQLMCRAEAMRARVNAPITVLRVNAPDHVALEARTIEIGGGGMLLRGLPTAAPGQLYQFDLHLFEREPAVSGQFRVRGVGPDGAVAVGYTILSARERGRLLRYVAERPTGRAA